MQLPLRLLRGAAPAAEGYGVGRVPAIAPVFARPAVHPLAGGRPVGWAKIAKRAKARRVGQDREASEGPPEPRSDQAREWCDSQDSLHPTDERFDHVEPHYLTFVNPHPVKGLFVLCPDRRADRAAQAGDPHPGGRSPAALPRVLPERSSSARAAGGAAAPEGGTAVTVGQVANLPNARQIGNLPHDPIACRAGATGDPDPRRQGSTFWRGRGPSHETRRRPHASSFSSASSIEASTRTSKTM